MLAIFFLAAIVSILQFTAVTYTRAGHFTFDLQMIVLVFFGLRYGIQRGLFLGALFGIFNGIFSINPFWVSVILYPAIGAVVGYLSKWFYKESPVVFILMVLCSLFFAYSVGYVLKPAYAQAYIGFPGYFFRLLLPNAVYNMVISIFLFYFLRELKI